MLIQSPAQSDQIARLRIAAQAEEPRAWLPAAVHAVITAILVRLFGRLEQMLLLWQSGTLPALPSRDTPHRAAAVAPCPPGASPAGPVTSSTTSAPARPRPAQSLSATRPASCPNAPTRGPHADNRHARPLAIDPPICRESPPCGVAQTRPISFRYRKFVLSRGLGPPANASPCSRTHPRRAPSHQVPPLQPSPPAPPAPAPPGRYACRARR